MDDDEGPGPGDGSGSKGGRIPDAFRKAVVSGISALFVTEESVRNIVSDLRLPKDAMSYVVQQTEKTRREMFRVVAQEVKGFLRDADVTGEIRRALVGLNVQVRADIKIGEDKAAADVSSRVKRHKRPKPGTTAVAGEPYVPHNHDVQDDGAEKGADQSEQTQAPGGAAAPVRNPRSPQV